MWLVMIELASVQVGLDHLRARQGLRTASLLPRSPSPALPFERRYSKATLCSARIAESQGKVVLQTAHSPAWFVCSLSTTVASCARCSSSACRLSIGYSPASVPTIIGRPSPLIPDAP